MSKVSEADDEGDKWFRDKFAALVKADKSGLATVEERYLDELEKLDVPPPSCTYCWDAGFTTHACPACGVCDTEGGACGRREE